MSRPLFGSSIILASTLLFAAATATSKYTAVHYNLSAAYVTMARFVLGLLLVLPSILRTPGALRPKEPFWVALRAATNVAAVFLFFFGIQYTTVSKANLLNMTYPVFVFVVAPFLIRERSPKTLVFFLALTLVGVWNVVRPDDLTGLSDFARGDALAFASAIVAGVAISALREARKYDSSRTIIFYMMAGGTLANAAVLLFVPTASTAALPLAIAAGALGAAGQFALTLGFRYVSAAAGALLSTARIPIAWIFGVVLFHDPLTLRSMLGTVLIVASLIGVALHGYGRTSTQAPPPVTPT